MRAALTILLPPSLYKELCFRCSATLSIVLISSYDRMLIMNILLTPTVIFSGIAVIGTVIIVSLLYKNRHKSKTKEDIGDEKIQLDVTEEYRQMYSDKQ